MSIEYKNEELKQVRIWAQCGFDESDWDGIYIEEDEVNEQIYLGYESAYLIYVDSSEADKLNELCKDYKDEDGDDIYINDKEDLNEFLDSNGYDVIVEHLTQEDDAYVVEGIVCYVDGEFIKSEDAGMKIDTFTYVDNGQNWCSLNNYFCGVKETKLTITKDFVILGEYAEKDYEHEKVHRIIEIDGKKVEDDTFLIVQTSGFKYLDEAAICDEECLNSHLEEVDREEYYDSIMEL